jgi:hypothetical protein
VRGETIGYCKLDRVTTSGRVARLRIVIDDFAETITTIQVRLFAARG